MKKDKCKVCGAKKTEGERHAHCSGCGALLGQRVKHSMDCSVILKKIPDWAKCPRCHRLLAAGAHCPEHGSPLPASTIWLTN